MDILIHLIILVIIGIFFFLYDKGKNENPVMFIIIFSLLGIVFLLNEPVEIINYWEYNETVNGNITNVKYITNDMTNSGLGSTTFVGFFWLAYIWFLFLGVLAMALGKKELNK